MAASTDDNSADGDLNKRNIWLIEVNHIGLDMKKNSYVIRILFSVKAFFDSVKVILTSDEIFQITLDSGAREPALLGKSYSLPV